ncbi:hypothetical protein RvVAT039_09860 [Agrobacterium vitis]|nr:hypothetical protein RvVAT039_09860 [Agrobacterium vitis]
MADPHHQLGCNETTKHKARRPGRAKQAENLIGIAFKRAAHRQKQSVQTIAEEQEQRAKQEGEDGKQISGHANHFGTDRGEGQAWQGAECVGPLFPGMGSIYEICQTVVTATLQKVIFQLFMGYGANRQMMAKQSLLPFAR